MVVYFNEKLDVDPEYVALIISRGKVLNSVKETRLPIWNN